MITGAAPVSPTILTFLRAALGCQVGCVPVFVHCQISFSCLSHEQSAVTLHSFMKATVRLNAQPAAPCQCPGTGVQVRGRDRKTVATVCFWYVRYVKWNLNSFESLNWTLTDCLWIQVTSGLLYPVTIWNWWTCRKWTTWQPMEKERWVAVCGAVK